MGVVRVRVSEVPDASEGGGARTMKRGIPRSVNRASLALPPTVGAKALFLKPKKNKFFHKRFSLTPLCLKTTAHQYTCPKSFAGVQRRFLESGLWRGVGQRPALLHRHDTSTSITPNSKLRQLRHISPHPSNSKWKKCGISQILQKTLANGEKVCYNVIRRNNRITLIKSGGGTGPMKPGNLSVKRKRCQFLRDETCVIPRRRGLFYCREVLYSQKANG